MRRRRSIKLSKKQKELLDTYFLTTRKLFITPKILNTLEKLSSKKFCDSLESIANGYLGDKYLERKLKENSPW